MAPRDQNPARLALSASGLPMLEKGVRWLSRISRLMRFRFFCPVFARKGNPATPHR
jgi:hypothetical protein